MSVHAAIHNQVLSEPGNPENALGILVSSSETLNHLPALYQKDYSIDEMKAYYRTYKVVSQLIRTTDSSESGKVLTLRRYQDEVREDVRKFARGTLFILKEALDLIDYPEAIPFPIAISPYPNSGSKIVQAANVRIVFDKFWYVDLVVPLSTQRATKFKYSPSELKSIKSEIKSVLRQAIMLANQYKNMVPESEVLPTD